MSQIRFGQLWDIVKRLGTAFDLHTHGSGLPGVDSTAIHVDEDGEINTITNKAVPAAADEFVAEDSADGYSKKAILFSAIEAATAHDSIIAGTILSHDTDTTGAELTALADGSDADALHAHAVSDLGVEDFRAFVQGTFREMFDALVTSDGATITMSLEQSGGGDLTMQLSDGLSILDCTPADTIALNAGSTTVPQANYVYVPQSTKVLTVSTSDWPSSEHVRVAYICVLSAAYVQTNGALINQNINDHLNGGSDRGHMAHLGERARASGAVYHSGCLGAGGDDYTTSAAGTVYVQINSGVIYQVHNHPFEAIDTDPGGGGDDMHIVNHDTTPYLATDNLYDVVDDATGSTLNNKFFNIVLWGVGNKTGQPSHAMINVPTGSYNTQTNAERDVDGHDVYEMPASFLTESSTGFLIARLTFRKTGGSWTYYSTLPLLGRTPATAGGGGVGGAITDFADNQFSIYDSDDNTRITLFDCSGITTGNSRVLTPPDKDIIIGQVDTSGTPVANDFARFTSDRLIEGRSYAETRDDLEIATYRTMEYVLELPTGSEGIVIRNQLIEDIYIESIRMRLQGTSPSLTWRLFFGASFPTADGNITASTTTSGATAESTGQDVTVTATDVDAGDQIWILTTAQSGTVLWMTLAINYKDRS